MAPYPGSFPTELLKLIHYEKADLLVMAAAADALAADCRFNDWVSSDVKSGMVEADMLDLIDGYDEHTEHCRRAIQEFLAGGSSEVLRDVLSKSMKALDRRFV